mmetsp:Transcript_39921/g.114042  ORF Transcript_39921/g.114042 Transcript_39921/m.114042 type:complete len:290 (-) Transcript_39921:42-911(-)|eukprot:CAMPEP_0168420524 /NCGR_PEP_ID=MMETSP0228-20121227/32818_1 /TAXON_ID=133427 /ORGANISM="Protoceratium reticulatum, Strain CCCM 535 (=CCMP 1889)" /LENGTH=289 /DNA_ID=CAMNT_0008434419 /DNA_START=43 /DNA_END=912 /DNA_ORIENTATION=-
MATQSNAALAVPGLSSKWMMNAPKAVAWTSEVAPRLACAGGVIGVILVNSTLPQVVKTSNGMMTHLTPSMWARMCFRIIPKAGGLKVAQYGVMREMKLSLDKWISPGLSTMVSFGFIGTVFQSMIYNTLIKDMYQVYEGPAAAGKVGSRSIAPGIAWCFGREMFSMGGGLFLGPTVKTMLKEKLLDNGVDIQDAPLRFIGGFVSGAGTALSTQWMHNVTLMAGRMAAVGETRGAPFFTLASLQAAHEEMGFRMFYANYPQRMVLIAGAVALLNMIDIFHRPDLTVSRML